VDVSCNWLPFFRMDTGGSTRRYTRRPRLMMGSPAPCNPREAHIFKTLADATPSIPSPSYAAEVVPHGGRAVLAGALKAATVRCAAFRDAVASLMPAGHAAGR